MKKTKSNQSVAIHECAHCYLISIFGNGPEWVKLYNDRGTEIVGKVHCAAQVDEKDDRKVAIEEVVVCLAGPCAELLFAGYARGFETDVMVAMANLKCIKSGAKCKHLRVYAEELVLFLGKARTWGRIMALADELVQKNRLNGVEIQNIFRTCRRLEYPPLSARQILRRWNSQ